MAVLEFDRRPPRGQLLGAGATILVVLGIVGALCFFQFGLASVAYGLWGVAAVIGVIFFGVPATRLPIYLAWMHAVYPLGWLISHAVLGFAYYVVISPIGLLMRALRGNVMEPRFDPEAESYWSEHRTGSERSRYFRQY